MSVNKKDEINEEKKWRDPEHLTAVAEPSADLPPGMRGTLLGDVATTFHELWGIPPLMTVCTGLGVASAATRGALSVQHPTNSKVFPLALYILALADSGTMKSALMGDLSAQLIREQSNTNALHRPIMQAAIVEQETDMEAIKALRSQIVKLKTKPGSQESEIDGLKKTMEDLAKKCNDIPPGKSIVVVGADYTYEAAVKHALANDLRIAFLGTEGTLIENLAGRYSSNGEGKTEFFNQAYDLEPFNHFRSNGEPPEQYDDCWGALTLLVQPDVITTMLGSANMKKRGFLQRFLVASIPPHDYISKYDIPDIPPRLMKDWNEAIRGIWHRAENPATLAGTKYALRQFDHEVIAEGIRRWRADGSNPLMVSFLSKMAMTSQRVAGNLTLIDDPSATAVTERSGTAAASFAGVMIEHAEYLYARSAQAVVHSPEFRVLDWLAKEMGGQQRVSTRDVHRRFEKQWWCGNVGKARAVLTELHEMGWLLGPVPGTSSVGRPSEAWEMHPKLAEHLRAMVASLAQTPSDDIDDIDNMSSEAAVPAQTPSDDIDDIDNMSSGAAVPAQTPSDDIDDIDNMSSGQGDIVDIVDIVAKPQEPENPEQGDIVDIVDIVASPSNGNGHMVCLGCGEPMPHGDLLGDGRHPGCRPPAVV